MRPSAFDPEIDAPAPECLHRLRAVKPQDTKSESGVIGVTQGGIDATLGPVDRGNAGDFGLVFQRAVELVTRALIGSMPDSEAERLYRETLQNLRQALLDSHPTAQQRRRCWVPTIAKGRLDGKGAPRMETWIDRALSAGRCWEDIVLLLAEWLQKRRSPQALLIAAGHSMSRVSNDLQVLRAFMPMWTAPGGV